jgi:hypothetical protein
MRPAGRAHRSVAPDRLAGTPTEQPAMSTALAEALEVLIRCLNLDPSIIRTKDPDSPLGVNAAQINDLARDLAPDSIIIAAGTYPETRTVTNAIKIKRKSLFGSELRCTGTLTAPYATYESALRKWLIFRCHI